MRVISEDNIEKKTVIGEKGIVEMMNFLEKPNMIIGTRTVPPNSSVPRKPHSHKLRQINYVIEGEPTLTSNKESVKLKKGDFVILESFEEHYYSTTDRPAHVFEVQFE
jgi:quercetin dioxygenase-like cupin family protein